MDIYKVDNFSRRAYQKIEMSNFKFLDKTKLIEKYVPKEVQESFAKLFPDSSKPEDNLKRFYSMSKEMQSEEIWTWLSNSTIYTILLEEFMQFLDKKLCGTIKNLT